MGVNPRGKSAEDTVPSNDSIDTAIVPNISRDLVDNVDVEQPSTSQTEKPKDTPPEGGYGWVCVICVTFINAHTWGVNATYGIFLNYYLSHTYFAGTSYLTYAFVGGLSISQTLFIAPLATQLIHKFGTKVCLHIGIFFETLSLIGMSFAHQRYQLILAQGFCFGFGMGFLFVGSVGIIPQWFVRRRSLANAVAAGGSGLGGLIYSLAAQRIIDTLGLPWAYRIIGICAFAVNLVASNLIRDRNKAIGSRNVAFDWQLLKRPEFMLFQGWAFFSMSGYCVVLFSLPANATSLGLSASQGSILGALVSLGQMLGRPLMGLASDKFGRLNVATLFTFLCGLFCFVFWIPAKGMGLLSFFAIFGGAFAGTFWGTVAPLTAEIVGLQDLPAALSLTWVLLTPPTTVSEAIALQLRRPNGQGNVFLNAQVFTGMMYVGGSLCLWLVRAWKVRQIDRKGMESAGSLDKEVGTDASPVNNNPPIAKQGCRPKSLIRELFALKHV